MNRHAESNIIILLTRNLPIESSVRFNWKQPSFNDTIQCSHPLMIPLHCLWAKSNNRTRGQFECDVTWFYFCLISLCSHARCGCFSMVCWGGWRKVGGLFKIGRSRSRRWKNFGRRLTRGMGSWKLDNFHGCHMRIVANANIINANV